MADAGGRSGGDDVARRQVSEIRYERDDLRDRIDQHVGARALHLRPLSLVTEVSLVGSGILR